MDIFVFGSNLAGIHDKGAAKQALEFGARYGQGYGYMGRAFGIPTRGYDLSILDLKGIEIFVNNFFIKTKYALGLRFLVTEIGCGLEGYTPEQIAPLFKYTINSENIYLPKRFWEVLNK